LIDSNCGFLFDKDISADFLDVLEKAYNTAKEKMESMGSLAKSKVKTVLSEENTIKKLEKYSMRRSPFLYSPSELFAKKIGVVCERQVEVIRPPIFHEEVDEDNREYEKKLKGKKYFLFFGSIGLV